MGKAKKEEDEDKKKRIKATNNDSRVGQGQKVKGGKAKKEEDERQKEEDQGNK